MKDSSRKLLIKENVKIIGGKGDVWQKTIILPDLLNYPEKLYIIVAKLKLWKRFRIINFKRKRKIMSKNLIAVPIFTCSTCHAGWNEIFHFHNVNLMFKTSFRVDAMNFYRFFCGNWQNSPTCQTNGYKIPGHHENVTSFLCLVYVKERILHICWKRLKRENLPIVPIFCFLIFDPKPGYTFVNRQPTRFSA